MKKNYFEGVLDSLQSSKFKKRVSLDFISLKSYEYWIRMMRVSKSFPDPDDSISIIPKERASRVLKDLSDHFERVNAEEDRIPQTQKEMFIKESNDNYAGKRLNCDDDNKSVAYQRRKKAVVRFNDIISRSCSIAEISGYVQNYLCGEGIFDVQSQKVFYKSFIRELEGYLEENKDTNDSYMRRLNIVQRSFNLTDDEMEIVIFAWIFFNKDQCNSLLDLVGARGRYRGTALPDVFPQLYPDIKLENAISNQGTLKRMGILCDDLNLSRRIGFFLDGLSGDDLESLFFRVYEGDSVPYKSLCRENPKVEMAYNMLKYAEPGQRLNLFFYGVEGTGKTELAKALAKTLRRPLILTNISIEGSHRESKEDSPLQQRMSSILFAAAKYKNKKAILLVDEARPYPKRLRKGRPELLPGTD